MLATKLRRVGGSTMFAVPAEILKMLHLTAGDTVSVLVVDGRLVVEPQAKPRYSLTELLANSDYSQPPAEEDREWIEAPAVGRELL
jgi:antitoxin ChpS